MSTQIAKQIAIFIWVFIVAHSASAATIAWTNLNGGNWSVANNWSPHQVPRASNDVVITASGTYAVTLNQDATVASLTLGGSSGTNTLFANGHNLTLTNSCSVGTHGVVNCTNVILSAPTLVVSGLVNWTNVTVNSGSAVIINAGGVGNFRGAANTLNPAAALTIQAGGVLNVGGYFVLASPLTNSGVVTQLGGEVRILNPNDGYYTGAIWNLAGGLWDLQGDGALTCNWCSGYEQFHNLGTLRKSASSGDSIISAYLDNNNLLRAQSGRIILNGGSNLGGSLVADAGATIQLGAGSFVAGLTTSFSSTGTNVLIGGDLTLTDGVPPNLLFNGGTVWLSPQFQGGTITNLVLTGASLAGTNTLTGTLVISGGGLNGPLTLLNSGVLNWTNVSLNSGSALTVASGWALNLQGYSSLNSAAALTIQAGGVLNVGGYFVLASPLTNSGVVTQLGGEVRILNPNDGYYTGAIWNLAGALWDLQGDGALTCNWCSGYEQFHNLGTLRKSAGSGVSTVTVNVINAGLLDAQTGQLDLLATNSLAGGNLNFGIRDTNDFGAISISGNAVLTGTMSANLRPGYSIAPGDSFAVLTYDSRSGSFASAALPPQITWLTNYGPTAFTLLATAGASSNTPPTLPALADQTVNELTLLTVTNSATSPGSPAGPLVYSLINPPAGAVIDSNGIITWTPSEDQGPGQYQIITLVSNTAAAFSTATNSFSVQVFEVNAPPVIFVPANRTIAANATLSVTCTASDPDIPANKLTFGLVLAPSGMTIDSLSGAILWSPSPFQAPSTNVIKVSVTDDGSPSLSATNSFTVVVASPITTNASTVVLTGVITDQCDSHGNTQQVNYWNTRSADGIENVFLSLNSGASGPFINGPDDANVGPIAVDLSAAGTYAFTFYVDPRTLTYADLNLFFNGDNTHPGISAKTPTDTTNSFSANSASNTFSLDASIVQGSGTLLFVQGTNLVRLTDFRWYNADHSDAVLPIGDRVGPSDASPDGTPDVRGIFTLIVATLDSPVVDNFSPTIGPVGTVVSFTGNNFFGVTNVQFNGHSAPFNINSSTAMTAVVPANATTGSLTLLAANGTTVSAGTFTVTSSSTNGSSPWLTKATLPWPGFVSQAVEMDGVLYVVGGWGVPCTPQANLAAYDPTNDAWIAKAPMHTARGYHAAAALNGKIYVVAGDIDCGADIASVEAYDPASNTWTDKAPLPQTRVGGRIGVVNGMLYHFGGSRTFDGTVFGYDPASDSWSVKTQMPTPRRDVEVAVAGGLVYLMGGFTSNGVPLPLVEVYDPTANTWRTGTPMPVSRSGHRLVVINGVVYAIGGNGTNVMYSTVDAYNPATDTWSTIPAMPFPREEGTAAALGNVLYVIGGYSTVIGYNSSVIAYSPVTTPFGFETSPANMHLGADGFHLRIQGIAGQTTIIYASSDLKTWLPIYTNPPASGYIDFVDAAAANSPSRYYRVSHQ
jgi:N-acetylneuraminic acid mutarotase